ncbi:hypothetical protein EE36_12828 [Sulfitobacter sp. EE-36]|nr:hypothetical protein EE36_12828 [Sulfitobacter sp. EE-36]
MHDIDPDSSIFAGGPLPPPLTKLQKTRKKSRDRRWLNVAHLRRAMTDQQQTAEERSIRAEIVAWIYRHKGGATLERLDVAP